MSSWSVNRRTRLALTAGVSLSVFVAAGLYSPQMRDVTLSTGDGSAISIGRLTLGTSLIGAALAQSGQTITLDNVRIATPIGTYLAPRLEIEGTSLTQDEVHGLLSTESKVPLHERLAGFSARRIAIPELTIEQKVGDSSQRTTYRNVIATDVKAGRAANLATDGGSFATKSSAGEAGGSFGPSEIKGFDLAHLARIYTQVAGEGPNPHKSIYDSFASRDIRFTDPKGGEASIAVLSGSGATGRLPKKALSAGIAAFGSFKPETALTPDQQRDMADYLANVLDAFVTGRVEISGIAIRDAKAENGTARIAAVRFTSEAAGTPAEARMEGLEFVSPQGTVRVEAISSTGFSGTSTVEGLREMATTPPDEIDAATLRKLVPTIGTVRVSGIAADVKPEDSPDRVKLGVKSLTLTADRSINGVPTNVSFGIENLAFSIPPGADDAAQELVSLGYRDIDVSGALAASWNEPGNEVILREVSVSGAKMGKVALRGVLGGVTKDAFDPDQGVAMVALLGATAKNLHLTLANDGLIEKLIAREAKKQGLSADTLRTQLAAMATTMGPAFLGNSAQAKKLGQAVGRFLAKPGELTVTATAKAPEGLGIVDLMSIDSPAAALESIDVTAQAN